MKRIISLMLISSSFLLMSCEKVPVPDIKILYYKYFLSTPKNYKESNTYPLIVFLHDYHANVTSYDNYKKFGLGEYAEENENFPFIVVAPQTEDKYDTDLAWETVKDIINSYSVDTDRIYITGFGMGGTLAYYLADLHPDSIAAIAVVAAEVNLQLAPNLKDVGVWIFHDQGDPVVSYDNVLDMYNALVDEGCVVKLTKYNNNTHSGWYETYTNPDLYTWFLGHSLKDR